LKYKSETGRRSGSWVNEQTRHKQFVSRYSNPPVLQETVVIKRVIP